MKISNNISLRPYNTFGIAANAAFFTEINSTDDIIEAYRDGTTQLLKKLVLGGGSNVLLTGNFNGLVLRINLKGINIIREDASYVWVKAGAGEKWHELVMWCIERNLAGIENLSLIPGNVGAAPMQNIGAYGVELKDTFDELQAFNTNDFKIEEFANDDCQFGYRESIFKRYLKGQYIITAVTLKLSKHPKFNISYGAIEQELNKMGVEELSIKAISQAVINIRQSKLPDPAVLGNAGSFFKNPEIDAAVFEELKIKFPAMVGYPSSAGMMKVAAGWLIEQCGWKGKRVGNTGSHKDQALVLVNYGQATGDEVYTLALEIKKSVAEKFGIAIEPEVNVI